jgi:hypothetical protein
VYLLNGCTRALIFHMSIPPYMTLPYGTKTFCLVTLTLAVDHVSYFYLYFFQGLQCRKDNVSSRVLIEPSEFILEQEGTKVCYVNSIIAKISVIVSTCIIQGEIECVVTGVVCFSLWSLY